jgi:mitogen-activated protein kinase kinase
LLELAQNRFPFPSDLGPIELMMYITTGEVRNCDAFLHFQLNAPLQPPRLEDEPGVQWSDDMKEFIKQTSVNNRHLHSPAYVSNRLTVDSVTRPTPKDMLAHPWIVNVMKQDVHMARWIRQVWGWQKPSRKSEGYVVFLDNFS